MPLMPSVSSGVHLCWNGLLCLNERLGNCVVFSWTRPLQSRRDSSKLGFFQSDESQGKEADRKEWLQVILTFCYYYYYLLCLWF